MTSDVKAAVRPSLKLPLFGVVSLTGRAQLVLRGKDRASFLHNFCTNDIKRLQPGQGCEAFLTNVKGRILGHIHVFAAEDALHIDSVPGAGPGIAAHLDRYLITEDVVIEDQTDQSAQVYAFGASALECWRGLEAPEPSPGGIASFALADVSGTVRRVDFTAASGLEIVVPRADEPRLLQTLSAAGAAACSMQDFHAWRIDAGVPMDGADLDDSLLAQEASRTAQAISFTKGCYLGQEPIARLDALGHVNRQLTVLLLDSADAPLAGGLVQSVMGEELGRVTSAAPLQAGGACGVALALIRSSHAQPGKRVRVIGPPASWNGTTAAPFRM